MTAKAAQELDDAALTLINKTIKFPIVFGKHQRHFISFVVNNYISSNVAMYPFLSGHYGEQLARVMKKMLLISEVAQLAKKIKRTSFFYSTPSITPKAA